MAETKSMRVVPSGKIYRQLFEAQVQLNRSLVKIPRDQSTLKTSRGGTLIPLVHMSKDDLEHGLLGERSQTWVDGFPNDPYVENPVVYKQYAEYVGSQMKEPDSSIEGREVRGLPDVVAPSRVGSNIIERIAASRKERHESAVEEMHQELSVINADMEPQIAQACEGLLKRLEEDDKEIASTQARFEKDEDLLLFPLDALHDLWKEIQGHSEVRQGWITDLDERLKKAEDDRMDMIKSVFQDYANNLEKIAHVMAPDLHRFMDKESQLVNQTVLSNRRAYGDLFVRLMSADIEREKSQHAHWKRRVEDWKMLKTELAIERFKKFMNDDRVVSPPGVQKVMQYMVREQDMLNDKRLELINQLRDLTPPSSTKTSVYHWNKGVQDVSTEIDTTNQFQLANLHKEYESVCQNCLDEIGSIEKELIETGVCSESRSKTVVEEFMIPLVGDRQRIYETNLEMMEKALEEHNKTTTEQLKSLFKYAQAAAHVWDVHEIGLARQERALQEKLEECRQQHDNQNQDKEAHLDIIMDRMRQDATEKALKDSLTRALDMLEKIRHTYEIFHKDQTNIVKQYPDMVKSELKNFDDALCRLFMVDRNKPTGKGKKKPFAMKPAQKKESKDLPSAVNEVLSTKKGTTFYVLTVAGEHGIPADQPETPRNEQATAGTSTFMTEVSGLSTSSDGRPDYLKSIDVKDTLLNEIKRQIRINFLNHLEEWIDQAAERAQSVVVAKCEELNSELDLRLHLHKPRARRAEYDVHNVRAAELVMHSERVTRHCKGIQQALTEVRNRLTSMTSEHNNLAQKFRQDIESLEVVFINATKASKLYGLKNQLNLELDKFMSVIRASLRQFRQHLDETLQMLRESNARFIKSFKVFSDGGNFCPEEIEEYRKRLDKMANNIDKAEGSIMSDLEDMESKRLEQATKVAMEFEDRFKNHLFDLIFMEKIARWLTNTQVKIKGEVANSNTQAQRLGQHLLDIDRRIDACERPNLDKEQITSHQLNDSLRGVFEAFKARSVYLDCLKDPSMRPPSGNVQTQGARVGFAQESGPTPISKAGKQPSEDPSVNVIKGIMKSNKSKLRFGMDAALDGDLNPSPDGREKMKSSMSTAASSERGKVSRHGGPSPSNNEGNVRKAQSAAPSVSSRTDWNRRSSKPARYEKKTVIFGDVSPEEEDNLTHFLGIIRKSLKEALDGLLSSAEMYYRQKGTRPVTRPQALQETFEQCADVIVQKLQSYFQQADEYHNQCLQEFRSQLQSLEKGVAHIPELVVSDLLQEEITVSHTAKGGYEAQFIQTQTDLEKRQEEHKQVLRPGLGHPHQKPQLEALCQQETDRHNEYVSVVEEHAKTLQTSAETHAKQFVEALSQLSGSQLVQYDDMLVIDDIEKGRVETKKYPTTELIRRKNAGEPLEDDEDKDALPRGRGTWPGVPMNELVSGEIPSKPQLTATVTTAKTTLGHSATVTARDKAFKEYKGQFMKTLQEIEEEKQRLLVAEQRWMDSWNTSVDKVKQLYQ